MRQHRLHVSTQLVCRHALRLIPLPSGEVNMGVPKTGEDYTAIARENLYPGWDAQLTPYTSDLSSVDEDSCVCFSLGTRGKVYRCVRDDDVLGHSVAVQSRKCQDENQTHTHTRVYEIRRRIALTTRFQRHRIASSKLAIGALPLAESPVDLRVVGNSEFRPAMKWFRP